MAHKTQRFHNKQPDKSRKIIRDRHPRCPGCGSKGRCVFFPNLKMKPGGKTSLGQTWCTCSNCGRRLFRISTPAERDSLSNP